jgi:hypothetical protein
MQPQLRDTGWDVKGRVYHHKSGATVERRCYLNERGKLVFEARINGGDWHKVKERFHETLARALKARRRRRAA